MEKAVLMSVMVAIVAVPLLASRDVRPRRAARAMLLVLLVFNAVYVLVMSQIFVRVWVPEWFQ